MSSDPRRQSLPDNLERWKQIDNMLQAALAQAPEQRATFLREACAGDAALLREVESLLLAHERAGSFLESPSLNVTSIGLELDARGTLMGRRIGPYELVEFIGAGGMGEVYRARDTRLDRSVAIKILSSRFSQDAEMRARLEREARAVSRLNHPHVCALYDIGHDNDIDYLVMEYLEGETLGAQLAKGPLPLEQALRYGIELADALAVAHRQGITHRDVKPGNIMVTRSGCKLLDFGLAKLAGAAGAPAPAQPAGGINPNLTTAKGTIVGTIQYMAPEQLEGAAADSRTDIFAFGAVLYEMITGRKAFEGRSSASLIASIMTAAPSPLHGLVPAVGNALNHVIRRCLAKDPDERWQNAGDVKKELQWIEESMAKAESVSAAPAPVRRFRWIPAAVIGLALVAVGLPAMRYLNGDEPGSVLESTRFPVSAPDGMMLAPTVYFGGPAISPDGKKIVFAVLRDGQSALYLRSLDSVELRPVKGGRDAHHPFWSPDSRQIGFFTEGKLKTLNLTNGALQTLCDDVGDARDNQGKGATWNQDNDIVFAMPRAAPLYRIPAQGGTRTQITTLDSSAKEESHRWPFFLPDGRHFLYLVRGKNSGVYVGSLDSEKRIPVMADQDSSVIYAPPGYLLFVRDESLMAQPFDAKTMVLSGKPFRVDGPVAVNGMISRGLFSASGNGRLVFYSPESADLTTRIVRFSRDGQEPGPGSAGAQYRDVRLSPDGLKLAYSTRTTSDSAESTLWLLDVSSGRQTSFSADMNLTVPHSPVWSPDGNQVYFAARAQNGHDKIYRTRPESTEKPELFLESEDFHLSPLDLSRDGKFLLLQARPFLKSVAQVTETKPVAARSDLWFAPLTAPGTAKAFMATAFIEKEARFSPNGQWVVYASDESGSDEIYIRAFPSGQMKTPVSTGGGASPKWSGDGASIVYMAPDRTLISVSLTAAPNAAPRLGAASSIMSAPGSQVPRHQGAFWLWDMSADAHTFYFVVDPVPPPMIVALNWLAGRDN